MNGNVIHRRPTALARSGWIRSAAPRDSARKRGTLAARTTRRTARTGALDNGRGAGSGNGQPVLQDVRITPDAVNNTLLIYADQANYRIIEATLLQVDQPQLQVAIDATIAEVTLNNDLSYGVQSYLTSKNLGLKPNTGSILGTQATTAPATTIDPTTGLASVAGSVSNAFINRAFPGFNFLVGSETQPSVILDALHTVTTVKVLSNPSLVVINNQMATLQVGDVVPVSTGSANVLTTSNTIVNTIDYRNTGIILRVSPRINVNGDVRLDIEQEISNVLPTATADQPDADGVGAKGQELDLGGDRPDRAAGRIDQRTAKRHPRRHFRCSTKFPVSATPSVIRTIPRRAPN